MQGVLLKKKRIAKYISKYGIFWYWVLYNFIRLETMKLVLTLSYREWYTLVRLGFLLWFWLSMALLLGIFDFVS